MVEIGVGRQRRAGPGLGILKAPRGLEKNAYFFLGNLPDLGLGRVLEKPCIFGGFVRERSTVESLPLGLVERVGSVLVFFGDWGLEWLC